MNLFMKPLVSTQALFRLSPWPVTGQKPRPCFQDKEEKTENRFLHQSSEESMKQKGKEVEKHCPSNFNNLFSSKS